MLKKNLIMVKQTNQCEQTKQKQKFHTTEDIDSWDEENVKDYFQDVFSSSANANSTIAKLEILGFRGSVLHTLKEEDLVGTAKVRIGDARLLLQRINEDFSWKFKKTKGLVNKMEILGIDNLKINRNQNI